MRARLPGILALFACIGLLVALGVAVRGRGPLAIDTGATAFLHGLASPPLDTVMEAVTTLGSTSAVVTALLAALLVLAWHRHGSGALLLGIAGRSSRSSRRPWTGHARRSRGRCPTRVEASPAGT